MIEIMLACASSIVLGAVSGWPPSQVPVDHTALDGANIAAHEVHGDFNGDGQDDVARLFADVASRKVVLWLLLGEGRAFPLESMPLTPQSRSMRLSVRHGGGDPTCPTMVRGQRDCGRSASVAHYPAIVVHTSNAEEHIWAWNRYAYMREEVFP